MVTMATRYGVRKPVSISTHGSTHESAFSEHTCYKNELIIGLGMC